VNEAMSVFFDPVLFSSHSTHLSPFLIDLVIILSTPKTYYRIIVHTVEYVVGVGTVVVTQVEDDVVPATARVHDGIARVDVTWPLLLSYREC
jgi:hypothetical protein